MSSASLQGAMTLQCSGFMILSVPKDETWLGEHMCPFYVDSGVDGTALTLETF